MYETVASYQLLNPDIYDNDLESYRSYSSALKITPEQKNNILGACKDLRENPKKAQNKMNDGQGGRCCLCVMEDYMIDNTEDTDYLRRSQRSRSGPLKSSRFYNFFGKSPILKIHGERRGLMAHNDYILRDVTHTEIAGALEKWVADPKNIEQVAP